MRSGEPVDGILLLDKPSGPSSNRVLQHVKHLYGARKAGHAGTLDPMASGLLPLLFGEATKFASYLSDGAKSYRATVALGLRTTTGDITGEVLATCVATIAAGDVERVLDRFRGSILQTPPMYSAVKVAGERLYRLARQGEVALREPRRVVIEQLKLLEVRGSDIDVFVRCSKGTYVRVLAEDMGAALGCGGTLRNLRRTAVADFDLTDAWDLDALQAADVRERLSALKPVDTCLGHLPALCLSATEQARVRNGLGIAVAASMSGPVRLYETDTQAFLGLGAAADGSLKALRLLAWRAGAG